jgi:hypothetical protein
LHGGIGASIVREANKAKSSAAARIAVLDDNLWRCQRSLDACRLSPAGVTDGFLNLAVLLELGAQSLIVGVPRKASVAHQSQLFFVGEAGLPNE